MQQAPAAPSSTLPQGGTRSRWLQPWLPRRRQRQPDEATMKALNARMQSQLQQTNAEIAQVLTPEQRTLFAQVVPSAPGDPTSVSSLPSEPSSSSSEGVQGKGPGKDDSDKETRRTKTEQQQRERSNTAGLDEYHTEGNVIAVRCAADQPVPEAVRGPVSFDVNETPYAVIATRDGAQQVRLLGETAKGCGSIQTGEYLVVEGVKQHEYVFDAEDVSTESPILR